MLRMKLYLLRAAPKLSAEHPEVFKQFLLFLTVELNRILPPCIASGSFVKRLDYDDSQIVERLARKNSVFLF